MRTAAIGQAAACFEGALIEFFREKIVRLLFTQCLKPDIVILAFLSVLPTDRCTTFNGYFLCYKLEIFDYYEIFITASESLLAKHGQEECQ